MDAQRLEARVIAIVEAVLDGRQVEDDRVELKAEWPVASLKVARQIAGHANAAGGEAILWIIGLDEGQKRLGSTSGTEPANWWSAVQRHFQEVPPDLTKFLRVPVSGDGDVLVLEFSSDRAPYVVGVEGGGQVQREVPWRTGNSTRTAHRHEIIRSIVSEASVPHLELIGGVIEVEEFLKDDYTGSHGNLEVGSLKISCLLDVFLSPQGPAHLPEHRQSLSIHAPTLGSLDLGPFKLTGTYRFDGLTQMGHSRKVIDGNLSVLGNSSLDVSGPGQFRLRTSPIFSSAEVRDVLRESTVELDLRLPVDRSDRVARLTSQMIGSGGNEEAARATSTWVSKAKFAAGREPNFYT